jgi:hypothetical protein
MHVCASSVAVRVLDGRTSDGHKYGGLVSRLAHHDDLHPSPYAAGRYSACNSRRRLIMPKPNYKKAVASLAYIHMLVLGSSFNLLGEN